MCRVLHGEGKTLPCLSTHAVGGIGELQEWVDKYRFVLRYRRIPRRKIRVSTYLLDRPRSGGGFDKIRTRVLGPVEAETSWLVSGHPRHCGASR